MPLAQIKQTRAIVAALGAGALIVAAAGCTSSGGDGNSTAPTTGITQSAGSGSGPSGSASPSGSTAPSDSTPKPLSYKHISNKQGAALNSKIGGLPGVTSTAYYPDSHVFEVYMSASADKLDRTVVQNLVKQQLAKSAKS